MTSDPVTDSTSEKDTMDLRDASRSAILKRIITKHLTKRDLGIATRAHLVTEDNRLLNTYTSFLTTLHLRTAYEEYGAVAFCFYEQIRQSNSYSNTALTYVHEAKWVNRDISAGNIYMYWYGNRELQSDFEYARPVEKGIEHEVKTVSLVVIAKA